MSRRCRYRLIYLSILICIAGKFALPLNSCAQYSHEADSMILLLENTPANTSRIDLLNQLSRQLRRTDHVLAAQYLQEAKQLSESLDLVSYIADCQVTEGMLNTAKGNWTAGREHYLRALELYTSREDYNMIADAALKVGITYGVQSDYHKALEYFLQSLEANKNVGDRNRISDNLNNIGHCYKYLGDYELAVEYYNQALALSEEMRDTAGIAMMYNHLGIIYDYQGNYKMALDYYFKSLRLNKQLGITNEIGALHGNIGIIYHYLGDYKLALEHQQKQLKLSLESQDQRGIAAAYYNLGNIYESTGNLAQAIENYQLGLETNETLGEKQGIVNGYFNLGNVYTRKQKYETAMDLHESAIRMSEEIGYKKGVARSSYSLGHIFKLTGNHAQALKHLTRSLAISEELGYPEISRTTAAELSEICAERKDYRRAYEYHLMFKTLDDSLSNADNIKQITRLEMQYDFDQKQQEIEFEQARERLASQEELKRQKIMRNSFIAGFVLVVLLGFFILRSYLQKRRANKLLAEQKEEIQAMNERLKESLDEKEVLLKEIHHRVKNNLQIISSLLNLQGHNIADESVKEAVKEGQSRVKSMALIHQTLYQSDRLARIGFQNYLEQLVGFLASSYDVQGIKTSINAYEITLDIDTAIPLGLIVNELVSNAFKYAFDGSDQGTIEVSITDLEKDGYLLTVADNGKGLPADLDISKSKSLGLKLVNILTRQLKGRLTVKSENGTIFEISFCEADQ
jgi:two-component sensor histidine kinase